MQRPATLGRLLLAALPLVAASCGSLGFENPFWRSGEETDPLVARGDGDAIRQSDLDAWLKDEWFAQQTESELSLYETRREGLDRMIGMTVLEERAAAADISVSELVQREIDALGPVDDAEVEAFYAENRGRIRSDKSLDELRPQIREYIEEERPRLAVARLREGAEVEVLLSPPRYPIAADGPSRGPDGASVTIVEFSDYQCPYCKRVEPNLAEVLALYPDDVRLVVRHLPLNMHPQAMGAARAAVCADRMGRFWEYHDLLFQNQNQLGEAELIGYASQLGLEREAFEICLADPETQARIDGDIAAAAAVGATATPTFYINGIQLRGAKDAESFKALIDLEL